MTCRQNPTGIVAITCGTGCVLAAICLQFYIAYLAAANKSTLLHMVAEHPENLVFRENVANPNWYVTFPPSIWGMTVFACVVGVGLIGVGIWMSMRPGSQSQEAITSFRA
jgi:hypothetical protein